MTLDYYYELSEFITRSPEGGVWTMSWVLRVENHILATKGGDLMGESKLCNRLGQLRRHFPELVKTPPEVKEVIKKAAATLRARGRVVDFANPDPRLWISRRGGGPRW